MLVLIVLSMAFRLKLVFVLFIRFFWVLLIILFSQVSFGGVLIIVKVFVFIQILNHKISLRCLFNGCLIQQFRWRLFH